MTRIPTQEYFMRARPLAYLVWIVPPLITGLWSILLGQDANWDLRNYHYYNAYAWLTERGDFHVAPGQVATYYNPLLHIPLYYAIQSLSPITVGYLLGVIQGLNFPMLYFTARRVIKLPTPQLTTAVALVIALLGMTGAGFRSEVGTSFGDNLVSILILASLLLIVTIITTTRVLTGLRIHSIVILAGILAGCAVGLKQPSAIYAVGLCGALLLRDRQFIDNVLAAFIFGCGVLLGMAITNGFWMWELWQRYDSPLFPYFNHFFQSPWATLGDYRDLRFIPKNILDALLFPFYFVFASSRMTEIWFIDFRVPLLYVGMIVLVVVWFWRQARGGISPVQDQKAAASRYVLATIALSYLVWLNMFAIHRYLVGVELLVPLGLWLVIERLWTHWRKMVASFMIIGMLLIITTRTSLWGRVAFEEDYFGVTLPVIDQPAHSLVLATGYDPMAYLIPFFPPELRFLRIHSWFTGPSDQPNGFDRMMQSIVQNHRGNVYGLFRSYERDVAEPAFAAYGYSLNDANCQAMKPHIADEDGKPTPEPFLFCLMSPLSTSGSTKP